MKPFGYCGDPLFLIAGALYGLNRWWVLPEVHSTFLHGQFNDCLLIPCALPVLLWLQRRLGLREHDRFPSAREIVFHVAVWSVLFEGIGPFVLPVTRDIWDVGAYAIGGLLAWGWWRRQEQSLNQRA
jgi:hypothetical protein